MAVAGHIQVQGRAADNQVDLDSFAGAAGDNTRLVLEAGLKRQLSSCYVSGRRGSTNPEVGNTGLGLERREADLLHSSPGWTWL